MVALARIVLLLVYLFDSPFGWESENLVVYGWHSFHYVNLGSSQYYVVRVRVVEDQELGIQIDSFRIKGRTISLIVVLDSPLKPTKEIHLRVISSSLSPISLYAFKKSTIVELPLSTRICLVKQLAIERDITEHHRAGHCGSLICPSRS